MTLFDQEEWAELLELGTDPSGTGTAGSGSLMSGLAANLPPTLADIVFSPIVTLEAIFRVLAASGEALIIPSIAGGIGLCTPSKRRTAFLLEAIEA